MGQGEDQERVRATYRDHYDRLALVKRTRTVLRGAAVSAHRWWTPA
ncbi:hypothetical protein [Streptomyces sp. NPDC048825]